MTQGEQPGGQYYDPSGSPFDDDLGFDQQSHMMGQQQFGHQQYQYPPGQYATQAPPSGRGFQRGRQNVIRSAPSQGRLIPRLLRAVVFVAVVGGGGAFAEAILQKVHNPATSGYRPLFYSTQSTSVSVPARVRGHPLKLTVTNNTGATANGLLVCVYDPANLDAPRIVENFGTMVDGQSATLNLPALFSFKTRMVVIASQDGNKPVVIGTSVNVDQAAMAKSNKGKTATRHAQVRNRGQHRAPGHSLH